MTKATRKIRLSNQSLSRRTVLKTAGIVALSGAALSGKAAAQFPHYPISAEEGYWGVHNADDESDGRSTEGLSRSAERRRNEPADPPDE